MGLLAGHFQVAAAGEIAVDSLFLDDSLDKVDGFERSGVHVLHSFTAIPFDQRGHGQFHPGQDHAAVAAACAPAQCFSFEQRYAHTALRHHPRCRKAAESSADDGDVHPVR